MEVTTHVETVQFMNIRLNRSRLLDIHPVRMLPDNGVREVRQPIAAAVCDNLAFADHIAFIVVNLQTQCRTPVQPDR